MIRKIEDFDAAWSAESGFTLKIFDALTDASLSRKVTPEGRSLGFLAWHITTCLGQMISMAGLPAACARTEDPAPATAAQIVKEYETSARSIADLVRTNWTDNQLSDQIQMFGQTWTKAGVLEALIAHQCHHRGQMTVLMRQAGLRVPGIYGPAREEWAAFGMEPLP